MDSTDEPTKHVARKLTTRKRPVRASSVQYPERLRVGDDVQEDVTAANGKAAHYMNQSVFSMIAAAGSKTDFHARFEGEGSDSEEDQDSPQLPPTIEEHLSDTPAEEHVKERYPAATATAVKKQTKPAERRGLRSLPKLKLRTNEEKSYMSQSVLLPSKAALESRKASGKGFTPRDAPVLGKMLQAQAELEEPPEPLKSEEARGGSLADVEIADRARNSASLATRLMEIFGFEKSEEVISGMSKCSRVTLNLYADRPVEYPCWLLQSVLLQGYLYVTQRHICFFGYLPKKSVSH